MKKHWTQRKRVKVKLTKFKGSLKRSKKGRASKQHGFTWTVWKHESPEEARKRHEDQNKYVLERSGKWLAKKGRKYDIRQANALRDLGFHPTTSLGFALEEIPKRFEGARYFNKITFPRKTILFLKENFPAMTVAVDEFDRQHLHFPKEEEDMSLIGKVAKKCVEKMDMKPKQAKFAIEQFLRYIRLELKDDRRARVPGIGILRISYRPAKEKRKGRNPFNGEQMWFKAKPAANKLKYRPDKTMKEFVNSLEIVAPVKKSKKGKKEKKSKSKSGKKSK